MLISSLDIPDEFKDFYTESGIRELYPPQAKAVNEGLLKRKNILAAIPTASGKTLLAELSMIKGFESGKKSLYIVPLRALASEKFRRFSMFEKYGISVGISTGDFENSDEHLGVHDWIVATSEKVDSLFRNETTWLSQISVVVIDEIHLLDSADRGPTLEIVITKLRKLNPDIHIVALSATVGNAKEVAAWLDAKLVKSEWRPTKLKEGIFRENKILFKGETKEIDMSIKIPKKDYEDATILAVDIIKEGGQCLVFDSSRRNTMSFCNKMAPYVKREISNEDSFMLNEIAFEITEQSDTELSTNLASCIKSGTAFHHAGLSSFQREYVEQGFLRGYIKVIVATPTLAAGLNLPARRVIIRKYKRYEANFGMAPIPVLDYKQMAGRAGRPHLDPYGESVLLAANDEEVEYLKKQYINAKSENITSKLATETALRTHILATVSNGFAQNKEELLKFFKGTFFAYQEGMISTIALNTIINKCLDFLIENDMIYIKDENEDKNNKNSIRNDRKNSGINERKNNKNSKKDTIKDTKKDNIAEKEYTVKETGAQDIGFTRADLLYKIYEKEETYSYPSKSELESDFEFESEADFESDFKYESESKTDFETDFESGYEKTEKNIFPTNIGYLVSKLYIDPMTASIIIKNLIDPFYGKDENEIKNVTDIGILHVICSTPDIRNLYMRNADYERVQNFIQQESDIFLIKPDFKNKGDYEWFLSEVKTAMLLSDWISEVPEKEILERYDVGDGDIRTLSENAEWIAGAATRLATLLGSPIAKRLNDIQIRLKYGASTQLLSLLKIKNIGRVRARKLYNAGYSSKEDLLAGNPEKIAGLIGKRTTEKVMYSLRKNTGSKNYTTIFDRGMKNVTKSVTRNTTKSVTRNVTKSVTKNVAKNRMKRIKRNDEKDEKEYENEKDYENEYENGYEVENGIIQKRFSDFM